MTYCPKAYAVLKDTCRRFVGKSWKVAGDEITWNMIPYDVQLVGAIVLHQGKIAEMRTGEGKTLNLPFSCIPQCTYRKRGARNYGK